VTQAREVESLGSVGTTAGQWDEVKIAMFDPTQSALTWFQPESSLGVVAGTLKPGSCFSCETYTKHLGYPNAPKDEKVNVAEHMLKTLFSRWKRCIALREENEPLSNADEEGLLFRFGDSTDAMVMVSGNATSLPWKKSCADMDGSEDVPEWVAKCVLENEFPISKQLKMSFVLLPKRGSNLPPMAQSSLTAPRVLEAEKMLDYVIKRLKSKGVECHKDSVLYEKGDEDKELTTSEGQVILMCDSRVVPSNFTLAAVRQWMWKKPENLRIEYSVCKGGETFGLPKIRIPS
jgi:hypothetical protein